MLTPYFTDPQGELAKLPERWRRRIEALPPLVTGCWLWCGALHYQGMAGHPSGYGRTKWNGRNWLAHRAVYTFLLGDIPGGLVLDHVRERCNSRRCVRPDHLEPVTELENTLRGCTWRAEQWGQHDRAYEYCT